MIGKIISKRIEELGISIPRAAERCGIPKTTLYSYINEKRMPTLIILKKISTGLNISIEELAKDEEDFNEIMCDPEIKIMFEKVGKLSSQARKSIVEFIEFVYNKEKK